MKDFQARRLAANRWRISRVNQGGRRKAVEGVANGTHWEVRNSIIDLKWDQDASISSVTSWDQGMAAAKLCNKGISIFQKFLTCLGGCNWFAGGRKSARTSEWSLVEMGSVQRALLISRLGV